MKFVFDLDGTICFKGAPISETIITAIERLKAHGHEAIFASARPIRDLLPILPKRLHAYTMIGGNGALIYRNGFVEQGTYFETSVLDQLKEWLRIFKADYLMDSDWDYAYTGPNDHPILKQLDVHQLAQNCSVDELNQIVKILVVDSCNMQELYERIKQLPVVIHRCTVEGVFDISPANIHKWSALQAIGVEAGSYIVFGNDANDVTMFQHAWHSVMIGHHDFLSHYASEQLDIHADIDMEISKKIDELCKQYTESEFN